MIVELGAPVVLADASPGLWHIPQPEQPYSTIGCRRVRGRRLLGMLDTTGAPETWRALCGLAGPLFVYRGLIRGRRCCPVCLARQPGRLHAAPACDAEEQPPARRGRRRLITGEQIAAIHKAHTERGLSIRELSRRLHERFGYRTIDGCAEALRELLRDAGLETRSQPEATRLLNYRHGRRPRSLGESGPDVAAYRRWLREERGNYQPECAATARTTGRPCARHAVAGSDYCQAHDPARRQRTLAVLAAARARQPRVPWAQVRAQLDPWLATQDHPVTRLSEATGIPQATCSRLLLGQHQQITVRVAERLLAVVELERVAA